MLPSASPSFPTVAAVPLASVNDCCLSNGGESAQPFAEQEVPPFGTTVPPTTAFPLPLPLPERDSNDNRGGCWEGLSLLQLLRSMSLVLNCGRTAAGAEDDLTGGEVDCPAICRRDSNGDRKESFFSGFLFSVAALFMAAHTFGGERGTDGEVPDRLPVVSARAWLTELQLLLIL